MHCQIAVCHPPSSHHWNNTEKNFVFQTLVNPQNSPHLPAPKLITATAIDKKRFTHLIRRIPQKTNRRRRRQALIYRFIRPTRKRNWFPCNGMFDIQFNTQFSSQRHTFFQQCHNIGTVAAAAAAVWQNNTRRNCHQWNNESLEGWIWLSAPLMLSN